MKNIVFLGSKDFGDKNNAKQLMQECLSRLGETSANFKNIYYEDLLFHISNTDRTISSPSANYDLKDSDLVIAVNWYPHDNRRLRDMAFTISLYLKEHDVTFWNGEMNMQRSTTKLSSAWQLSQFKVDIPETFFSLSKEILFSTYSNGNRIVKSIAASRGRNNYLIKNLEELKDIFSRHSKSTFMMQEFIPNDYDIRLVCFGGKPSLAIKRQRQNNDTHLNNTSQGAAASLINLNEIPSEVLAAAENICRLMGRELAGIDFIVAKSDFKRYICLEVNAVPQLTSGSFIDQKFDGLSQSIANWLERKSL
jgi:glutathione synthase/RimK-type ligase-like ATP-grasp enzyme